MLYTLYVDHEIVARCRAKWIAELIADSYRRALPQSLVELRRGPYWAGSSESVRVAIGA